MQEVHLTSPATVANVVCGFDVLGFALSEPRDDVTVRVIEQREVRIRHLDRFGLPTDPERNVAGISLMSMMKAANCSFGFEVEINKKIKPGSGIGSSAASAAGVVVAANHLLSNRFSQNELIEFAMDGEFLANNTRHADNVAPAIMGGFTLVRSHDPLDVVSLDYPDLFVTVLHPQIEIRTSDARAILKQQFPLRDIVKQNANIASLVAGLAKADYSLISRSLEDHLIQPSRGILIPRFAEAIASAKEAGALGGGIAGSGPSIFLLSENEETAKGIKTSLDDLYSDLNIEFNSYLSKISPNGALISDSNKTN